MAVLNANDTPYHISDLNARVCLIQNIGPGVVYMDSVDSVNENTGFKIDVGGVYETSDGGGYSDIYLMSDTEAEVRIVSI